MTPSEAPPRGARVFSVLKVLLITVVVVAVLAVAAVALVLRSVASSGDDSQHAADVAVERSAQRYTEALRAAFTRGPVAADQVLALRRPAYLAGGGVAQGIRLVGARTSGRAVIVTFQVSAQRGGGFDGRVSGGCFRDEFKRSPAGKTMASRRAISCSSLLGTLAPGTSLRVR